MLTDTQNKSITLYYCEGSSDKVYQACVEPKESGFVVNFAFGRRGSTLQTGTKTAVPVDYQTAVKIYDKLVREKMAKGYTPGEDGTPYQGTKREEAATGVFPQLLNSIDESQAQRLIEDDGWWMQEKFDGKRILIRKDGQEIVGINRKGLVVALPQTIVGQALSIGDQWLMDGEAVGNVYFAFDLLEKDGVDLRAEPYSRRLAALDDLVSESTCVILLVDTARNTVSKRFKLAQFRENRREGVVFKRFSAPYTPGRPNSGGDQLKLKFTAAASCIVARANGAKRSVALELLNDGQRIAVGNVTIPPSHQIPKAGSVVEVRYLYAYPGGSLFQPVYLGERDDIDPSSCIISQLKYKADGEDEDESVREGGVA